MATQRYISTSFWTDKWIRQIDPSERYIYIYLLTNPETNIAGVYDVTIDRMAFDTGYDERTLRPILDRFAKAGKAHFINDEWVVIPAWPKHQRVKERDNNRKGIDAILKALPSSVFDQLESLGYEYLYLKEIQRPLQAPSKPLARESNYSEFDSDLDSDTDTDIDLPLRATDAPEAPQPISPLKDELANQYQSAFTSETPAQAWKSIPQERKHLNDLAKRTRSLSQVTGREPGELAASILDRYAEMKRTGRKEYWKGAPFTPSGLTTRWDAVVESLKQDAEVDEVMIF